MHSPSMRSCLWLLSLGIRPADYKPRLPSVAPRRPAAVSTRSCVCGDGHSNTALCHFICLPAAGVRLLPTLRPRCCCGSRGGKPAAPQRLHVLLSDDQRMRHWLRCWARAAALFPPRCPPPPNPTAALAAAPLLRAGRWGAVLFPGSLGVAVLHRPSMFPQIQRW